MDELGRWGTVLVIVAYVGAIAWLAPVVARDMDERGRNGKLYGLGVLVFPPAGLLAWWAGRRSGHDLLLNAELLLVALVTFPLSLIFWLVVMRPWDNLRRT